MESKKSSVGGRSILIHCGWAAAVAVAFVSGRGGSLSPSPDSASPKPERTPVHTDDSTDRADGGNRRAGTPPPGSQDAIDELRGRFFAALEEPNSLTRLRRTMDFYATLDASSWEAAYNAMTIETVQTGRTHDLEWRLLLQRSGEVGGEPAMKRFFKEGNRFASSLVVTGWATTEPNAARAWVESLPAGQDRATFVGDLVDGMVVRDPGAAASLLASLPAAERSRYADKLMRGSIQTGGYAAATVALEQARKGEAAAGETGTGYTSSLFATLADRMLFSNWTAKTPQAACRWIGEHAAPGDLHPALLAHAAKDWAHFDPPGALDWVGSLSARVDGGTLLSGVGGVVGQWVKKDANSVGLWLNANPDHPLSDQVAYGYAESVMKLDPAAANWIEAIKDPALRERAQQRIPRSPVIRQ